MTTPDEHDDEGFDTTEADGFDTKNAAVDRDADAVGNGAAVAAVADGAVAAAVASHY